MNQKNKTRFALIGLGRQGEKIANTLALSKNAMLTAVVGENSEHTRDFANRHGGPKEFTSIRTLIKKDIENSLFDVAFIASPNYRHAKEAVAILNGGKDVIVEKPLALNVRDGKIISVRAKKNNARGVVDFHLRHHSAISEAKKIIKNGTVGNLRYVNLSWSIGEFGQENFPALNQHMKWREDPKLSGGGALMARGVHLFDLLQFFSGKAVVGVRAYTDQKEETQVDRDAVGILELEGGAFATVLTSKRIPATENRVEIFGETGRIKLVDVFSENAPSSLELSTVSGTIVKKFEPENLYLKLIEDFDVVRSGDETLSATLVEGARIVAVTDAFLASAKSGRAVSVVKV